MGRLKPIGSEKLKGDDKIKRIMEIAQYGEVEKNKDYHTQTTSFTKKGADGKTYAIVQEFDGYYLKSGINESKLDYVSGMMNKKKDRFKSYGAALKRMNLIFKPLNEEYNEGKGISMYEQLGIPPSKEASKQVTDEEELKHGTADEKMKEGEMEEQEKFVLKVPNEGGDEEMDMDMDMEDDMGDEEMDMDMDMEDDMGDEEMDIDVEDEMGGEEDMEGFMKSIQKLTGKLGQKLRDVEEEMGSSDIKYVLNSVISAVDLNNLDDEDKEDVLDRFEDDETTYGDEEDIDVDVDMDFEEAGDDMGMEDEMEMDMDDEEIAMESLKKRVGSLLESYIKPKEEVKQTPQDFITNKINETRKINKALKKCSSIEQEVSTKKFIKENKSFNLNGVTKRGSLVFTSKNDKIIISKDGKIK